MTLYLNTLRKRLPALPQHQLDDAMVVVGPGHSFAQAKDPLGGLEVPWMKTHSCSLLSPGSHGYRLSGRTLMDKWNQAHILRRPIMRLSHG